MKPEFEIFSKKEFASYIKTAIVREQYYSTAAGTLKIKLAQHGIFAAEFVESMHHLMNGSAKLPDKLILVGTEFQIKVWKAAFAIPHGQTISYQTLANKIGKPKAYRAVANALANNNIAYFIPCHRVLRSDGSLGGYKWGIDRKKQLLKIDK